MTIFKVFILFSLECRTIYCHLLCRKEINIINNGFPTIRFAINNNNKKNQIYTITLHYKQSAASDKESIT